MEGIKKQRFIRVASNRMKRLSEAFNSLGNCARKDIYDYTEDDVRKIIEECQRQTEALQKKFSGQDRFTLN